MTSSIQSSPPLGKRPHPFLEEEQPAKTSKTEEAAPDYSHLIDQEAFGHVSPHRDQKQYPPTPQKPVQSPPKGRQIPYLRSAKKVLDKIKVGKCFPHDPSYIVTKKLGSGEMGIAYLLENSEGRKIVAKFNRPERLKKNDEVLSQLASEAWTYARLRQIGFPVALHFDLEPIIRDKTFQDLCCTLDETERHTALMTFLKDRLTRGYHLVKYIPKNLPPRGESFCKKNPHYLVFTEVKRLFKILHSRNIHADFSLQNSGRDKDGSIRYFDLPPIDVEEDFKLNLNKYLDTFAHRGTPLWNYLDPRQESESPQAELRYTRLSYAS